MQVDAATLGLAFSAVSTLIVVVGAIAALRQLTLLRRGNELTAIGKFLDEWSSAEFVADRMLVRDELPAILAQAGSFDALRKDPRMPRVFRVAHFFERLALFVRQGAISETIAMELFGSAAIMHWEMLREFIMQLRGFTRSRAGMEWFEDFAMRAPEWEAQNQRRPKGLRRDPMAPFVAEPALQPPSAHAEQGLAAPET